MKLVVQFDIDADILEVPQFVIDEREQLRKKFLSWIYNRNTRHKYWVKIKTQSGTVWGLRYRSDAFVEWLNKKVLKKSEEKAVILQTQVWEDEYDNLPSIFF